MAAYDATPTSAPAAPASSPTARNPQKARARAGEPLREIASTYWRFAYDPSAQTIESGPHVFSVHEAVSAAGDLAYAIYMAARQVDLRGQAT
ncbi:hypothetical protein [Nocardioides salarius]|uniref:hypothetical protein n=1 Tax=Nocardioides salarius TaxID=374513 RepID=UPI0030FD0E56